MSYRRTRVRGMGAAYELPGGQTGGQGDPVAPLPGVMSGSPFSLNTVTNAVRWPGSFVVDEAQQFGLIQTAPSSGIVLAIGAAVWLLGAHLMFGGKKRGRR